MNISNHNFGHCGPVVSKLALVLAFSAMTGFWCQAVPANDPPSFDTLSEQYTRKIRPLLDRFCLDCHSSEQKEGDLDLQRFATIPELRREASVWVKVVEMLVAGEMPPEDAPQPAIQQQTEIIGWAKQFLHAEALAGAGDPGPVVLRRLTNAEYTWTIRDLTGVDLNPAREFPTEGAAGEGFTNTGNALVMSPGLLRKYLAAGREVAAHTILMPDGFRFSPHTTRRDWTDSVLAKIREFYQQRVEVVDLGSGTSVGVRNLHVNCRIGQAGKLPLERYFAALLGERVPLNLGMKTIAAVAADHRLSSRYLQLLWKELHSTEPSLLLNEVRSLWREAGPDDASVLADAAARWQRGLWTFNLVGLTGRRGSRPLWQEPVDPIVDEQAFRFPVPAMEEDVTDQEVVISLIAGDCGDGNHSDFVVWNQPRLVGDDQPDVLLREIEELRGIEQDQFGRHPDGSEIDAGSLCVKAPAVITLRLPATMAAGRTLVTTAALDPNTGMDGTVQTRITAGESAAPSGLTPSQAIVMLSVVTSLFPEHREVSFENPVLVAPGSSQRQLIKSAVDDHRRLFPFSVCYPQIVPADEVLTLTRFHREDEHLVRLLLNEAEQAELDLLWDELRFISQDPLKLGRILDSLVEATKGRDHDGAFDEAVETFHARADAFRRRLVKLEPMQLDALVEFTAGAWRRPLTQDEESELRDLYRELRKLDLTHEEAFRLTLGRILVASPFLYRLEEAPEGTQRVPVTDWELANRLSYFLWSSVPDAELRAAAESGRLTLSRSAGTTSRDDENNLGSGDSDELLNQTRRMLTDNRIRRLAEEFACQWLHIHNFDPLETKSERLFPEFNELRPDMYEESVLFFTDLFQNDGSLLSLLNADHTFVNERLAGFYDIPLASPTQDRTTSHTPQEHSSGTSGEISGNGWRRVDGIRHYGRGGILALAATLAKQSGTTRTSPILRGNWISEVLLGEKLPRPPKNVPALADEVPEGLTERQLIERHSSDTACAKCHARIDPFGFALEGFDAIGRRRNTNAGGRMFDTFATLPDGTEVKGLDGLRRYLLVDRGDVFTRQFCRKLLGYALGRELQLSDEPLLDEIMIRLAKNDYRFSVAVATIVLSDQFRMIRGRSTPL